MVALLGQRDELLKLVEAAFDSEIVVRGNEITIGGPDREVERVALLFGELITLLERGHELTASNTQLVALVLGVAEGRTDKAAIAAFFRRHSVAQ